MIVFDWNYRWTERQYRLIVFCLVLLFVTSDVAFASAPLVQADSTRVIESRRPQEPSVEMRSTDAQSIRTLFSPVAPPETTVVYSNEQVIRAQHVIRNVMSPYCPGLSLESCPSPDAHLLRNEIRRVMAEGQTEEEVRSALVSRYGRAVLGIPPDDNFGKLAWSLPFIALLGAGGLVTFWLRNRVRKDGDESESREEIPVFGDDAFNTPEDKELLEQLREKLSQD